VGFKSWTDIDIRLFSDLEARERENEEKEREI